MPKDRELSQEPPCKSLKREKYVNDARVLKVASHKTADQGAASLTMNDERHPRVGHYVDMVRPQMDPLSMGEREWQTMT